MYVLCGRVIKWIDFVPLICLGTKGSSHGAATTLHIISVLKEILPCLPAQVCCCCSGITLLEFCVLCWNFDNYAFCFSSECEDSLWVPFEANDIRECGMCCHECSTYIGINYLLIKKKILTVEKSRSENNFHTVNLIVFNND